MSAATHLDIPSFLPLLLCAAPLGCARAQRPPLLHWNPFPNEAGFYKQEVVAMIVAVDNNYTEQKLWMNGAAIFVPYNCPGFVGD